MENISVFEKIQAAVKSIQERSTLRPKVGIVLGSGLGPIADQLIEKTIIPYGEIPYFHRTSVEGHAGKMILGEFHGIPVVFLQGRFHVYEGYPMEDVVFPTRTVCGLGIQTLILTNAAGGVNTKFRECDLMVINDHINLMGDNPLKGHNIAEMGPRFPDMSEAYNHECIKIIEEEGKKASIPLHYGVYAGLLGPTYETPAEVRMLRTLGADAVGMSTVPESIAANHLGVEVVGISCITNLAAGISNSKLSHDDVVSHSKLAAKKLSSILEKVVPRIANRRSGEI